MVYNMVCEILIAFERSLDIMQGKIMAPGFPIRREQKKMKASDSSSSQPNFDSDRFRSKKCEEYYATTNKRGILLRARPTWRRPRAQNQKPDANQEQKVDCILHDMEVLCRRMQIGMEDNQRIEDLMRNLWEKLNLNVMPTRKRTTEEVAQFVDWRPFGRHHVALEEGSQDDLEEEDEDESEEDGGEYEEYEMKKAVILHNNGALSRMHQVYMENRLRMKDIARQMYEGLRRNDPPITDLKDEEIASMVNWAETFWKTYFNT
jgi:hypothetical protein